jgi:hypothetical protein
VFEFWGSVKKRMNISTNKRMLWTNGQWNERN